MERRVVSNGTRESLSSEKGAITIPKVPKCKEGKNSCRPGMSCNIWGESDDLHVNRVRGRLTPKES